MPLSLLDYDFILTEAQNPQKAQFESASPASLMPFCVRDASEMAYDTSEDGVHDYDGSSATAQGDEPCLAMAMGPTSPTVST